MYDIPVAEQAPCSWELVRPDEPCSAPCPLSRVPGPGLYCPEHGEAMFAIASEPSGLGRKRGVRKASGETAPVDPETKRRQGEAMAYVASYTGSWGLVLDIRADRRWGTKHMRLSERQVEVLLAGRDRDLARRIDTEVAQDDHAARLYAERDQAPAPVAAPRRAAVDPGMYRKDGVIFKVQLAVHGSGKPYAKRLDHGTFIYEVGAINRLTAENRMTLDQAEEFGKLYGICCVCGATLTDEKSIARGIGPVCAGRV